MKLDLSDSSILLVFFLLILPWIAIVLGIIFNIENAWYFLLSITWFGSGVVFFGALS